MNKMFVGGMLAMLLIISSVVMVLPKSASQVPPPTDAYDTVHILNNANLTESSETSITAIKFNDDFYLATDGSINLSISKFP